MRFLKNFQQAFLIKPMSSGHAHKIVIPAARHLPQKFCIVATEHLISAFSSGALRKKGAVFQHHNLKIQKFCHANQRSRHMPGSADHKLCLLSQGLHKYFLPVYPLKSFSTQLPDAGLCKKCTLSALLVPFSTNTFSPAAGPSVTVARNASFSLFHAPTEA